MNQSNEKPSQTSSKNRSELIHLIQNKHIKFKSISKKRTSFEESPPMMSKREAKETPEIIKQSRVPVSQKQSHVNLFGQSQNHEMSFDDNSSNEFSDMDEHEINDQIKMVIFQSKLESKSLLYSFKK